MPEPPPGSSGRLQAARRAPEAPGRRSPRTGPARERCLLVAAVLSLFVGGYFLIAWAVDPCAARSLRTPLDDRIPFVPESVFVYLVVYPGALFPVFVVRSAPLLRRVATSYALTILLAFACFLALPVTSVGLRAGLEGLGDGFAVWAVRMLYALDPPTNLFPSLHLALVTLAVLSARKAGALYGGAPFLVVAGVSVSICTVKQHFWLDGVAGLALAATVYALLLRGLDLGGVSARELRYSWRGSVAYLAAVAALYLLGYAAYRAGLSPPSG